MQLTSRVAIAIASSLMLHIECASAIELVNLGFSEPLYVDQVLVNDWQEGGFHLQRDSFMGWHSAIINQFGYTFGFWPSNGTDHLAFLNPPAVTHVFRPDGKPFHALSIDIAEYSSRFQFPAAVEFVGIQSDMSTVSATFLTDGFLDGDGRLPDFEAFVFPTSFVNLIEIQIPSTAFAIDNFQFQVVPEPGTATMIAIACLLVTGAASHRRRRSTWRN